MDADADASGSAPSFGADVIVDCGYYDADGRRPGVVALADAGAMARSEDGWVWIGIHEPHERDIHAVAEEFGLPALAVEDAVKAHQRPKLEVYDDVLFVVIKAVTYVGYSELEISELALFVGEDFVVTVRHGPSDVPARVRRLIDASPSSASRGPVAVLYEVLDAVVDEFEVVVETLGTDGDDMEARVFRGDDVDHAPAIYHLKRDAAQIRRALVPLAVPVRRLASGEIDPVPKGTVGHHFRDVADHVVRAIESLDASDRMLTDMLQANLAQVSVRQAEISLRQNEDMRKISAWAAIAVVPTAVGGIYGMNFEQMPELAWEYGYPIVLGIIAAGCLLLFWQFRKRGWL